MLDQPESYKVDVTLKSEMPRDAQQVPNFEQSSEENNNEDDKKYTTDKPEKISKSAPKRPLQPTLRYPYDILNDFTDYLQINVVEYTSSGKSSGQEKDGKPIINFDDLVGSPGSRKKYR